MRETLLLGEMLDPLTRCLDAGSAQRVVSFRIAPSVQERVEELAAHANEGLLNSEERAKYEALISASEFISILKLKARRSLQFIRG